MAPGSAVKASSNDYRKLHVKHERLIAQAKKGPMAAMMAVNLEAAHNEEAGAGSAEFIQKMKIENL